jgi:coenzyme F420 hydrogenase subunit beta
MRAAEQGVVVLEPLELEPVARVQPLQVKRKRVLFGRLLGRRLAGRAIPRYAGYGLLKMAMEWPKENLAAARGAFERSLPSGLRRLGKRILRISRKSS